MTRVKRGINTKRKHKKILKLAKGYYGAKSKTFKAAKQTVIKSHQYAYRDRKYKKRRFRSLWIIVINAALKKYNINYSSFINLIKKFEIKIDRKNLYTMIQNDEKNFELIVNKILESKNESKG